MDRVYMAQSVPVAENQVPDLPDCNLYLMDEALVEGVRREGAGSREAGLETWGARLGRADLARLAAEINRQGPVLRSFDRRGMRIDVVEFHPGWSEFLSLAFAQGMHGGAWTEPGQGAQVARAAHYLMHGQVEAGSLCPVTMTSAAIPLLMREPWFHEIRPLLASREYDDRDGPLTGKRSMMVGMGMTERQGGSDLRANLSRAEPQGKGWFRLTGHKWFFSSPMSDAHLVLARDGDGHSCFYLPRWLDEGRRNPVRILRLKDKLGNRSNASAEVEFEDALARRIGEPGRGIATLVEMASYTRLDCVLGSTALMRQALVQGVHHARHRRAFGRLLIDQPLMRQVLADLALESEAATVLALRLAGAFDRAGQPAEQALRRLLTPAAKFWICKRAIDVTAECMEVWGGNGYVEDGPMARLYREAPVNSIWEGSGNVMCLDVLRAARQEPQPVAQTVDGLARAHPGEPALRAAADRLLSALALDTDGQQAMARMVARDLVLLVQADLLLRHAPDWLSRAFVDSRLGAPGGDAFGARPVALASDALLQRAWPG
ncbi:acyl-CoA dehydrogenase family protein [Castellaniella sp.]|uniref:acyl-CoA dehydrogenase family protein n=1 Tax=Castellaniella sp. TaxID=1955812 RepID=UPI002D80F82F|nr:acyl-CoA dehydrogenase family protein [Castellaniella sp.]HET8703986.1 acyl-CoA dehydrogenase family protein [Castellaniella sp.]